MTVEPEVGSILVVAPGRVGGRAVVRPAALSSGRGPASSSAMAFSVVGGPIVAGGARFGVFVAEAGRRTDRPDHGVQAPVGGAEEEDHVVVAVVESLCGRGAARLDDVGLLDAAAAQQRYGGRDGEGRRASVWPRAPHAVVSSAWSGISTVKTAPPSGRFPARIVPPCRRTFS